MKIVIWLLGSSAVTIVWQFRDFYLEFMGRIRTTTFIDSLMAQRKKIYNKEYENVFNKLEEWAYRYKIIKPSQFCLKFFIPAIDYIEINSSHVNSLYSL